MKGNKILIISKDVSQNLKLDKTNELLAFQNVCISVGDTTKLNPEGKHILWNSKMFVFP